MKQTLIVVAAGLAPTDHTQWRGQIPPRDEVDALAAYLQAKLVFVDPGHPKDVRDCPYLRPLDGPGVEVHSCPAAEIFPRVVDANPGVPILAVSAVGHRMDDDLSSWAEFLGLSHAELRDLYERNIFRWWPLGCGGAPMANIYPLLLKLGYNPGTHQWEESSFVQVWTRWQNLSALEQHNASAVYRAAKDGEYPTWAADEDTLRLMCAFLGHDGIPSDPAYYVRIYEARLAELGVRIDPDSRDETEKELRAAVKEADRVFARACGDGGC